MTLSEEQGEYRHGRDDRQADDEGQRQPGEAQVVTRPGLLVEEQLEPPALLSATPCLSINSCSLCPERELILARLRAHAVCPLEVATRPLPN